VTRSVHLSLKSLRLQNIATFENQEISFDPHLNAIIGETGSGKSLILEALELILGQRADKKIIRKNSTFALVEAVFHAGGLEIESFFSEMGFPFENNEVIIKRIVYPTESSKSYVNLQLCSLNELNFFAKKFIDLVGQFENQKLRTEEYQLLMLDSFGKITEEVDTYRLKYREWQELKQKLETLKAEHSAHKQREDYLRFQVQEIENLNPTPDEEVELLKKKHDYQSIEKRKAVFQSALLHLSQDDQGNALGLLKTCLNILRKDGAITPIDIVGKLQDTYQAIEDISFELTKNLNLEFSEGELEKIMDRLDSYQKLKNKFSGNIESVLNTLQSFKGELTKLENLEIGVEDLEKLISKAESDIFKQGNEIHNKRKLAATQLSKKLTLAIRQLKMVNATVDIRLSLSPVPRVNGLSLLAIMVETNAGDGFYQLNDIVSGGELSRLLLAFRQMLSVSDSISIFFFDEIDSGIGGETALAVGRALKDVSEYSQVIAITHLPQLAHFANRLIEVSKNTHKTSDGHKTTSKVREISGDKMHDHVRSMTPL
jgi:DNA repair protein RecN (Recombination protein N)